MYVRRAALLKWKIKLGKDATYSNLISIFEAAGYKTYAENIKRMVGGEDDTGDSSDDEKFPQPQPPTYPDQFDHLSSKSSLPEPPSMLCEPFCLIDSDTASKLPEGKSFPHEMLKYHNYNT